MKSRILLVLSVLLAIIGSALADQGTLKNSNRLSGTITKSDGKTLVIKTDLAGDVTVKFNGIKGITSTGERRNV